MIDISQSRNDTERIQQFHVIIDAYLDAFMNTKDKDAFVSAFLCAIVDLLQPNVVNAMIAEALKFSSNKGGSDATTIWSREQKADSI